MSEVQSKPSSENGLTEEMKKAIQDAELYIINTLSLDTSKMTQEEVVERKKELAKKIRLVVASDIGIKPSAIRLGIIDNHGDAGYTAYWRRINDESKPNLFGEIIYDKEYFENSSFESFIKTTCHELGHTNQRLKEEQGESAPERLGILQRFYNESEERLISLRHGANEAEYDADMFAYGKTLRWIIEARKKGVGGNQRTVGKLLNMTTRSIETKLNFVASKTLLSALGFMDSMTDVAKPYRTGLVLNPRDMYERNIKNEENGHRSVEDAEKYIKQMYGRSHLTQREKLRIADLMSVILADGIGMMPRDIGMVVLPHTERGLGYQRVQENTSANSTKRLSV